MVLTLLILAILDGIGSINAFHIILLISLKLVNLTLDIIC